MSELRKKRKELQVIAAACEGFVCGNCGRYNEFDEKKPLVCEFCGYGEVKENGGD